MQHKYAIIGAPTSAGSYAPGQEKAPDALRQVGFIEHLRSTGAEVVDLGNTRRSRWRADKASPKAMNVDAVVSVAQEVKKLTERALDAGMTPVIIGGDCSIEVGVVSAALEAQGSVGLIYIDGDADLRTPEVTSDGALDWMGLAHLLALPGTIPQLAEFGPHCPMLEPSSVALFGPSNIKTDEQRHIVELDIHTITENDVKTNVEAASRSIIDWSQRFDKLLVHLDVDVIDFEDFPLAENTRRKQGLTFNVLVEALKIILSAPNLAALTICEINPDHGEEDGSTLREFSQKLATALSVQPGIHAERHSP